MPLLDIIFPKQCLKCQREGNHCCQDCLSLLSLSQAPSPLLARSSLSALYCATSFEDTFVQQLIHSFKYPPFLRDLAVPLAYSIIAHFSLLNKPIFPPDALYPIPLHTRRLKWRGYNHAEELAKQLGQAFSLPVVTNVLLKTKHTIPQASLGKEKRLNNMRNAFVVQNPQTISSKSILLVDDVYTTGATMEEAAKTLKKAGAAQVFGVTVARG